MRPPDALFADQRLASLYDALDGDRDDLDANAAIADEVSARVVVDVGCGTGSLALRLARRGLQVVGVDPAAASLDVARAKPDAHRVTWVLGDVTAAVGPKTRADLVVMAGNVAQVFVSDGDWARTLDAAYVGLRPGGWLVLETRRPEIRDWESWELAPTALEVEGSVVTVSRTVTEVALPLVSFAWSFRCRASRCGRSRRCASATAPTCRPTSRRTASRRSTCATPPTDPGRSWSSSHDEGDRPRVVGSARDARRPGSAPVRSRADSA